MTFAIDTRATPTLNAFPKGQFRNSSTRRCDFFAMDQKIGIPLSRGCQGCRGTMTEWSKTSSRQNCFHPALH